MVVILAVHLPEYASVQRLFFRERDVVVPTLGPDLLELIVGDVFLGVLFDLRDPVRADRIAHTVLAA